MADLIDRQQVIDTLNDLCKEVIRTDISFSPGCANYLGALHDAKNRINQLLSVKSDIIRCSECKHNPKQSWFGCPMSGLNERQRPETAWCWKGEKESNGGSD